MANDTEMTIIGNLTDDPKITNAVNSVVVNFDVASTPSVWNKNTNSWENKEPIFMRCAVWRDQAKNLAESLRKGDRVIVKGKLSSHAYDQDGKTRRSIQIEVDEVGPSLKYATAVVTKKTNSNGGGSNYSNNNTSRGNNTRVSTQQQDTNGWGSNDSLDNEEAPF